MLRAAKAPKDYIEAAKAHRCNTCEQTKQNQPTNKVSRPKPYEFNAEVGIDVAEVKDAAGRIYDVLNCVDYGTTFEQAVQKLRDLNVAEEALEKKALGKRKRETQRP